MMKKSFPAVLALLAIVMTGCLSWTDDYTPLITISQVITNNGDTLKGHYNETTNLYELDTLTIGDTATFLIYNQSFANNLVTSGVTWDDNMIHLWTEISSDFMVCLNTEATNLDALQFSYVTGYNQTVIPVHMLPKKVGSSKIHFTVESDASEKYRASEGILEIFIQEKEQD